MRLRDSLYRGRNACLLIATWLCCVPAHAGMMTVAQYTGNVRINVIPFGQVGGSSASGTFNFAMAGTTSILNTFVLSGDFLGVGTGGGALTASINGTPLGTLSPFDQDAGFAPTSFAYQWNAGSVVTGSGTYNLSISAGLGQQPANQLFGAALIVVTQDASFTNQTITINAGVLGVGDSSPTESVTTTFTEFVPGAIGAGNGVLSLFTLGDDPFNTGEQLSFNNQSVLLNPGDFDANLGTNASFMQYGVTTTAGSTNQVNVTTNSDLFNWHLAVLESPVPTPGSTVLLLGAGACLLLPRHRKHIGS